MIPQYQHSVEASFIFWAENLLLASGQAYKNYSSPLYYSYDERLPANGLVSYASPFKQWVYDTSVPGATIAQYTGVSGSLTITGFLQDAHVDYQNGRLLLPNSVGTGASIGISYALKEFNFYLANETEENLVVDNKYYLNSRFGRTPTSGIRPYDIVTPAIFVNTLNAHNEPRALGGLRDTKVVMSMIVMAENQYQLNGVLSLYDDQKDKCIVQLSINDDPLDQWGDVKTGLYPSGYSYINLRNSRANSSNLLYINSVRSSKLSDALQVNPRLFVGIVDFELSSFRQL